MNLLAILVIGLVIWAMATGKVPKPDKRQTAALALGAIGVALLARGKALPAAALIAAGMALWPWGTKAAVTSANMSAEEARALLGVAADADAETIRAAHRRLIGQTHPDKGGTEELARRINRARDIALSAIAPPSMNDKSDNES